MMGRRVVISGMGAVSPYGAGTSALWEGLLSGASTVRNTSSLDAIGGLRCKVAALVPELDARVIDRKKRRFMSSMSIYATLAALEAIAQSRLDADALARRSTGLCLGSTTGSPQELDAFYRQLVQDNTIENTKSTFFFRIMNHSCAANVAQALGIRGRVIAPSAACATGALAIGMGAEMIAAGLQDVVLCGGADEHHAATTAVFDIMQAASITHNDAPQETPRPFDRDRDGVVCSEGAGIFVLESLEHAQARGAAILGEIMGFATLSSPGDLAHPDIETIGACIADALASAKVNPDMVDYVNAHATGTIHGDLVESGAVERVVGAAVPTSSLKGHFGHAMAASAALESIACVRMLQEGKILPTRNLRVPDPACQHLNLPVKIMDCELNIVLKNSFALGGVNAALVIGRFAA
ncbi:MAG TPA: beta-ketoacyl-[acyl-carrier-protein] synthase family protein [Candidatus Hydrogenedentes bacterium]|nr:beta-ketoacyl-[acyl-carrier-protein] synthase family protein [Candidatus Hydrogenedentota bacterium]